MRFKKLSSLLIIFPLLSCSHNQNHESRVFCFDTYVNISLKSEVTTDIKNIENILSTYDKLSDNYLNRDVKNVYTINNNLYTDIEVNEELYDLLKTSYDVSEELTYFNYLCGSLSKKWKESLKEEKVLSNDVIEEELFKMNNTQLLFKDNNVIQKIGDAEIDLGGIAKGYALDKVNEYLLDKGLKNYLIDAGSSSILLGEKESNDGLFSVGLTIDNAFIKAKNCFISTSAKSRQGVKIGDITYSHIINPLNGSAINENDTVIVISDKGYLGDALSTSLMMNSVEEIRAIETALNVKTIVIKNEQIIYSHQDIEVLYH